MAGWDLLLKIVVLLAVAAVSGLVLQKLRQSVIVGYILAGVMLGPTGFGLVRSGEDVQMLSELGVALLLFAIGLEFSLTRLRELGRIAGVGGAIQMTATTVVVMLVAVAAGLTWQSGLVLGMALAMSSTAVVLRGLTERAELDSTHGRNAIAMLLFQDLAVIPVLIATAALSKGAGVAEFAMEFGTRLGLIALFIAAATAVAKLVLPRLLSAAALSGSRDLPVVTAVCASIGAAWGAHSVGFSPSLGSFIAGLVLAESPFATQIRADLTPLSAVFITLFFASIGTVVSLPLNAGFFVMLALAAVAVMVGKAAITAIGIWFLQRSLRTALITGVVISQVGEFTFVVAQNGYQAGLISAEAFQFTLGISLLTLIATPFAIRSAPLLAATLLRRVPTAKRGALESQKPGGGWRRVIVIGFGPAGQQVVSRLLEKKVPLLVLEMNPNTVSEHRSRLSIELGDATQREVLQHIGVGQSLSVIVTIPDPATARLICAAVQRMAPGVRIVVRSRYHHYSETLRLAGAGRVVDEEQFVGYKLADEAIDSLGDGLGTGARTA
jgi:monovalent cation:H+ antiporter-2, CPA2 family